ncbi:MAG: hypothetical protein GWP10_04120 [Nitrospiraceae bacterium]|nr:hypothetical protein [Nitrospiraceae bacterium]
MERHATSKIVDESDLSSIVSLGFRGEALPSIGAVSRLSISSGRSGEMGGWQVRMAFGRDKEITAVGCPQGTLVEVRDLFGEIPARRRFLKRRQTELGHISQIVRTLAVGFPNILFSLKSDGRNLFRSRPSCQRAECLWPLLGDQIVSQMLSVEGSSEGIRVSGYVTPPGEARASSKALYFFLNQRPISSRLLWKAVMEAFRGLMMKNSFPLGALFLDVQPDQVDVNVHPTKQEVRFYHTDAIYRLVYHSIQRALEGMDAGVSFGKDHEDNNTAPLSYRQTEISPKNYQVSEELPPSWGPDSSEEGHRTSQISAPEPSVFKEGDGIWKGLRIFGQLAKTYILAESPEGLVLVDQHAAHEGLIFKRLNRQLEQADTLATQPLAFPEVLDRSPKDIARLPEICPILKRIGVVIEPFGDSQVIVRSLPDFVASGQDVRTVVSDLMDHVLSAPHQKPTALVHDLLASMACHSAIKANHHLELQEIEALIREVSAEGVTHCPHGRPIVQILGIREIERRFGRR